MVPELSTQERIQGIFCSIFYLECANFRLHISKDFVYSDLNWLFNIKVLILVQNILLIYGYLQFAYHQYLKQAIYMEVMEHLQDMRKSLGKLFQQWGSKLYDVAT